MSRVLHTARTWAALLMMLPVSARLGAQDRDERHEVLSGAAVSAEASAKSVNAERTRINPSSSITTATGSVLDALKSSASVSVDGKGSISIRGNSNVLIIVDGVPTALEGLESIPAANVRSIDIITNPDAKYDAEGSGGIIRITSKKQLPESFSAMASFNYGFNNFLNGNVAVGYGTERWGLRLSYNGKYEEDPISSRVHRLLKATGNSIDQNVTATKRTGNHNIALNASFKATRKDILTLDFKTILPRMNNFQNFRNHYVTGGVPSDKFRQTDITFNRETFEAALGYRHVFIPQERELSFNASVSTITGHRPSYYYEGGTMVQKSESGGHPLIATFQSDYMTSLGKGRFEAGVKMTYRENDIDHRMFERDTTTGEWRQSSRLSNDLQHREYIPAAYAMYSVQLARGLSLKTGLRLEYSYVSLKNRKDNMDEHSSDFFISPNLVLEYRISDPWSVSLGFSRRISRPTYPQLNPYINLIDNQTYETGNMRLKPEKINKLDAGYAFRNAKLSISGNAYFNYTQNYICQIADAAADTLIISYINADSDLKAGLNHDIRWNIAKWCTMEGGLNFWYGKVDAGSGYGGSVNNEGWTCNANAGLTFRPIEGMNIQAQYFVTSPQHFPQFTSSTIHYCNIGIKQSFLRNSLTVSALVTDLFNTREWNIHGDNSVFTLENCTKSKSRMIWLGIAYNFNSFKSGNSRRNREEDRSMLRIGE